MRDLGFRVDHSKLLGLLRDAFTADPRSWAYIAIGCAAYAVIEVIEGVGLWLVKRWGEYFAMIVTSIGLPYEIWDLTSKGVTVLRVVAFLINLGLVLYLVVTKRLFGVRGGKKAYEARLSSESILDAEIAALAAEQAEPGRHAKPAPGGEPVPATEPPDRRARRTSRGRRTSRARGNTPVRGRAGPRGAPALAEPPGPPASEAPEAGESGVTVPPPLPRRHPRT